MFYGHEGDSKMNLLVWTLQNMTDHTLNVVKVKHYWNNNAVFISG